MLTLDARERRILGVLLEKALTTPSQYPLTLNALVVGCNQKSNRDPVTHTTDDQLLDTLDKLKERGLATSIFPAGGRTEKYRQEFTSVLELEGPAKGVIAELLLRGAQTVGELRTRASRMVRIPDLNALETLLDQLMERDPPLVVRLTPPGIKRGVRVTHNLYAPEELERIRGAEPEPQSAPSAPAPSRSPAPDLLAELRTRVDDLERRVSDLEAR